MGEHEGDVFSITASVCEPFHLLLNTANFRDFLIIAFLTEIGNRERER